MWVTAQSDVTELAKQAGRQAGRRRRIRRQRGTRGTRRRRRRRQALTCKAPLVMHQSFLLVPCLVIRLSQGCCIALPCRAVLECLTKLVH